VSNETASAPASETALERKWWLRAPAVLVAPRAVFASLRDDSDDAVEARQDSITAIAGLAGIAAMLATPTARHLLNDYQVSTVLIPVWAFFAGAMYAFLVWWGGGGLLHLAAKRLGGLGSWRRARHLLGLSLAPLALAMLTFWPLRILIYGEDLFRTGGDDFGQSDTIFGGIYVGILAWCLLLLLHGVRTVHGWSWSRAAGAIALAGVFPALVVVASLL
jgi:hypothetical protein